jgi:hypothetical protein
MDLQIFAPTSQESLFLKRLFSMQTVYVSDSILHIGHRIFDRKGLYVMRIFLTIVNKMPKATLQSKAV